MNDSRPHLPNRVVRPTRPDRALAVPPLVLAPLTGLAASLLSPSDAQDSTVLIDQVHDHQQAFLVAVLLGLTSWALMLPAVQAVTRATADRTPGWSAAARALVYLGVLGMTGVYAVQLVLLSAADNPDAPAVRGLVSSVDQGPAIVFVVLLGCGALGCLALAVAMWRSAEVPRAAAVLVGVSPLVGVAGSSPLEAVSAGCLLAGFIACIPAVGAVSPTWARRRLNVGVTASGAASSPVR